MADDAVTVAWTASGSIEAQLTIAPEEVCGWALHWGTGESDAVFATRSDAVLTEDPELPVAECGSADDLATVLTVPATAAAAPITLTVDVYDNDLQHAGDTIQWPPALTVTPTFTASWAPDGHTRQVTVDTADVFCSVFAAHTTADGTGPATLLTPAGGCAAGTTAFSLPDPPEGATGVQVSVGTLPSGGTTSEPVLLPFAAAAPLTSARATLTAGGDVALSIVDPNPDGVVCVWRWRARVAGEYVYGLGAGEHDLAEPAPECDLAPVVPAMIAQQADELGAAPDVGDGSLGADSLLWVSAPFHYDAAIVEPATSTPGGPDSPSATIGWTAAGVLRLAPLAAPAGVTPCRWRVEWHQPGSWATYGVWLGTSPGAACTTPPSWFDLPTMVESGAWTISVFVVDAVDGVALSQPAAVAVDDSALPAPRVRVTDAVAGYDHPVVHVDSPPDLACLLTVQWQVGAVWQAPAVLGDGSCALPVAPVAPHAAELVAPAGATAARFAYHRGPSRGVLDLLGATASLSWPAPDPPVDVTLHEQPDGSVQIAAVLAGESVCALRWRITVPGGYTHGAATTVAEPSTATSCSATTAVPAAVAALNGGNGISVAVDVDGSGTDAYAYPASWSEPVSLPMTYLSTPLAGGAASAPTLTLSTNASAEIVVTATPPAGVYFCVTPVRLEWERTDGTVATRGTWLTPCQGSFALPQTAAPVWGTGTWRIWAAYGDGTTAHSAFASTTYTTGAPLAAPAVRVVSPSDGPHRVEFTGVAPVACQLVTRWLTPTGWSPIVSPGAACSLPSPSTPFPLTPPEGATELAVALRAGTASDTTGAWTTLAWPPPTPATAVDSTETADGGRTLTVTSANAAVCTWRWRALAGLGVDQSVVATGAGSTLAALDDPAPCTATVTLPVVVAARSDLAGIELHPDVDGSGDALSTYTDGTIDGLWSAFVIDPTYVSGPVPSSSTDPGPSVQLRWSTDGVAQAVVTGCDTARIEWAPVDGQHGSEAVAARGRDVLCGVVDLPQLHGTDFSDGAWTVRAAKSASGVPTSAYTTRLFDPGVDADGVLLYTQGGAVRAATQGGNIWCNLRWRTGTGSGDTWETTGTFYAAPLGSCTSTALHTGIEVAAALAAGTAVEVTPMPTPDSYGSSWFGYTGPVTPATAEVRWNTAGAPVVVVDDPNPDGVICFYAVGLLDGSVVQPTADGDGHVTCDPSTSIELPLGARPIWVRPSGVPHLTGATVWSIAQQSLPPIPPAITLDPTIAAVQSVTVTYRQASGFHQVLWKPTASCKVLVQYAFLDDPLVDDSGPLWRTANAGEPVEQCTAAPEYALYNLAAYELVDELYGSSRPVKVRVAALDPNATASSPSWSRGEFVSVLFGGTVASSEIATPVATVHVGKPFVSISTPTSPTGVHCLVRFQLRRNGVVVDEGHMRKDNASPTDVCHRAASWMLPCSTSTPQVCSLANPAAYTPQLENGDELRFAFQRGGLTSFYDPDGSSGLTPVDGFVQLPAGDQPVTGPWTDWLAWAGNDTAVPTVAFVSPLPGRHVTGTIPVRADPADDVGVQRVDLYVDGVLSGTATTAPWAIAFDTTTVADGATTLDLRVWDHAGKTSMTRRTVFVDNHAPTVAFTTPSDGATVGGWVPVTATLEDLVGAVRFLELYVDDALYTRVRPTNPSTWWNTKLVSDGPHVLRWRVTDRAGNTAETTVSVTVDNDAPTVGVLWPNPGRHVRRTINVRPTFTGSDTASTTLYVNGVAMSTIPSSPVSVPLDTEQFADGPVYLVFKVTDAAGNVAWSPTRVVVVDNTDPQVRFLNPSPWPNKLVTAPETVTADVTDAAPLRSLALYVDNVFHAAATEANPSVTFDPAGHTGPVTLKWVAVDVAGNRGVVTRVVQTGP